MGSPKVLRALDSLARELADAIHARDGDASPTATVPDAVAQTSAPASGHDRFGTADCSAATAARKPGTVFREINEPWCPEMVVIPAGSFIMGSPEGEAERTKVEGPQHRVTFASPFGLGRYPVTFEEYDHFCDSTTAGKKPRDQGWGRGRRPVINVSFEDAEAYCAWLSARTGWAAVPPADRGRVGVRLPGGDNDAILDRRNYQPGAGELRGQLQTTVPVGGTEYRAQTTPVDTFEANPWGLHDMHGNVWEWCEDCWNDSYEGAPQDGSAWLQGNCSGRVVRGGSWRNDPGLLRSAARIGSGTFIRADIFIGFRVARTLTNAKRSAQSTGYSKRDAFSELLASAMLLEMDSRTSA